jgi:hypothetical protein
MTAATNELLVVFVSRFSQSCQKIAQTLGFLAPHINLKVVDIDNPQTRNAVISSDKIQTVPAVALLNIPQQRVEFYEGEELVNLINKAVTAVQQKVMAEQAEAERAKKLTGKTDLQQVLSGPAPPEADPDTEDSTRATMQGRASESRPKRGQGHEKMLSSLPAVDTMPAAKPKKTVTFIDDAEYAISVGDDEESAPRGLSREDILGPQGSNVGQEQAKKSSAISQRAKEIMNERGD